MFSNLIKVGLVLAVYASAVSSGSTALIVSQKQQQSYAILPACDSNSTDTTGPIDLGSAKNFSICYDGSALSGADTAVIDSGFELRLYMSNSTTGQLFIPSSADSFVQFFGGDTITDRTTPRSKGLTLDVARYLWLVIRRWDTNTNIFNLDNDSTALRVNLFFDK